MVHRVWRFDLNSKHCDRQQVKREWNACLHPNNDLLASFIFLFFSFFFHFFDCLRAIRAFQRSNTTFLVLINIVTYDNIYIYYRNNKWILINKTFLFLSFFSFLFLKMFYLQRWNNSLKYSRSYRWNLEIAIVLYNHTPDVIITISIRSIKYPVPIYFERKRNYNLHFEKRFSMRENNFHQSLPSCTQNG